jgi:hypothetical protein
VDLGMRNVEHRSLYWLGSGRRPRQALQFAATVDGTWFKNGKHGGMRLVDFPY